MCYCKLEIINQAYVQQIKTWYMCYCRLEIINQACAQQIAWHVCYCKLKFQIKLVHSRSHDVCAVTNSDILSQTCAQQHHTMRAVVKSEHMSHKFEICPCAREWEVKCFLALSISNSCPAFYATPLWTAKTTEVDDAQAHNVCVLTKCTPTPTSCTSIQTPIQPQLHAPPTKAGTATRPQASKPPATAHAPAPGNLQA